MVLVTANIVWSSDGSFAAAIRVNVAFNVGGPARGPRAGYVSFTGATYAAFHPHRSLFAMVDEAVQPRRAHRIARLTAFYLAGGLVVGTFIAIT